MVAPAIAPGEVVVAREFLHPDRGLVHCAAAPLLAEYLRATGLQVTLASFTRHNVGSARGALFAASYLEPAGTAVGLAVAASTDDPVAAAAAADAVKAWSGILRTRRILLATWPEPPSCDAVLNAQAAVREFAARGDTVILIGRATPVTVRLAVCAHASTVCIHTAHDIDELDVDPAHLSFIVVPGTPIEDAIYLVGKLRSRFPLVRGQHPDEFCYYASDRRETLRSVANASDLMLVCGAAGEHDTSELAEWSRQLTLHTHSIAMATQLRLPWLAQATTIGIAAAASARPDTIRDLIGVVSGLGPLSVVRRQLSTEVVRQPRRTAGFLAQDNRAHPILPRSAGKDIEKCALPG
ncbi:hypothetical protein BS330_03545 [Amycolatopsis keratiniphila subsp. nogabecina]|nr:hypothetical protein BS330_03545 [Amycolatopsis keratiniphila subsp. nogabecina]SDU66206.1 4-hydroxy-3-methylbut-2-enyl diphosphate reductase [Amycolatopsis keratiniphila]